MSDRVKARLVVAGTSLFLSVLVTASLLLAVGVLAGRLSAPTLPGGSQVTIALPALTDTIEPPVAGPGSIPPAGRTPGGGGRPPSGPGPDEPPTEPGDAPMVGARVSGDVGGLGLVEADVPIRIGSASEGTETTSVDLLGLRVELQTSDHLVEDVLCLVLC